MRLSFYERSEIKINSRINPPLEEIPLSPNLDLDPYTRTLILKRTERPIFKLQVTLYSSYNSEVRANLIKMNLKLLGTFIKNTDPIISKILDDSIVKLKSTYVIFDGRIDQDYPFLNSTFILWKSFDKSFLGAEKVANWIIHSPKALATFNLIKSEIEFESLRFIYIRNNQTIQFPDELLDKIDSRLSSISVGKKDGDRDLVLSIDEDTETAWLGIKISNHPDYHVEERKGALRPQLSYILNYLSELQDNEILLDPFAGSGEIPISASKYFKYKQIIAIESDPKKLSIRRNDNIEVIIGDFFQVDIADKSIDKIVTDPPWGNYDKNLDTANFYRKFFKKVNRIIGTDGIIVLLISLNVRDSILEEIRKEFKSEQYELKVWGRPAIILKLIKIRN